MTFNKFYGQEMDKLVNNELSTVETWKQTLKKLNLFRKSIRFRDFLDSITSMGMEPETLEAMQEQFPGMSFIYILQTNKQGSFYGRKRWEHLYDVVLRFEDGVVNVEKNRLGKVGEYRG